MHGLDASRVAAAEAINSSERQIVDESDTCIHETPGTRSRDGGHNHASASIRPNPEAEEPVRRQQGCPARTSRPLLAASLRAKPTLLVSSPLRQRPGENYCRESAPPPGRAFALLDAALVLSARPVPHERLPARCI